MVAFHDGRDEAYATESTVPSGGNGSEDEQVDSGSDSQQLPDESNSDDTGVGAAEATETADQRDESDMRTVPVGGVSDDSISGDLTNEQKNQLLFQAALRFVEENPELLEGDLPKEHVIYVVMQQLQQALEEEEKEAHQAGNGGAPVASGYSTDGTPATDGSLTPAHVTTAAGSATDEELDITSTDYLMAKQQELAQLQRELEETKAERARLDQLLKESMALVENESSDISDEARCEALKNASNAIDEALSAAEQKTGVIGQVTARDVSTSAVHSSSSADAGTSISAEEVASRAMNQAMAHAQQPNANALVEAATPQAGLAAAKLSSVLGKVAVDGQRAGLDQNSLDILQNAMGFMEQLSSRRTDLSSQLAEVDLIENDLKAMVAPFLQGNAAESPTVAASEVVAETPDSVSSLVVHGTEFPIEGGSDPALGGGKLDQPRDAQGNVIDMRVAQELANKHGVSLPFMISLLQVPASELEQMTTEVEGGGA